MKTWLIVLTVLVCIVGAGLSVEQREIAQLQHHQGHAPRRPAAELLHSRVPPPAGCSSSR